ncbi:hypothetical protein RUND412_009967 [Rhizina undulata]
MADFPSAAAAANGQLPNETYPPLKERASNSQDSESIKRRRPSSKVPKLGRETAFYILPNEEPEKDVDLDAIIREQKLREKSEVKEVIPEA